LIKIGSENIWLWVAIEGPENKRILGFGVSKERNMLIAEQFISKLVKTYGPHPVSTDGGTWYPSPACRFLKLNHHLHSLYQKSIIERTIQPIKERIECFDDYFSCRKKKCKLKHVINWFNLFICFHNKEIFLK
jgi:putative transposase